MGTFQPGQVVAGRYQVVRLIGEGDVGATYEATGDGGRRCLLKVLAQHLWHDPEHLHRFEKEARAATLLRSPHIVEVRGYGRSEEGAPFLVLEPLVGGLLSAVVGRQGPFDERTAVALLGQLCEGLRVAHAAGVVHRDVCPENIFVGVLDGGLCAKLLGFGCARVPATGARGGMTMAGLAIGTPEYMSPELAEGKPASVSSDIYACGCVAYEMVCGRPPFVSKSVLDVLTGHLEKQPVPPRQLRPELSKELDAAILHALAKSPAARPSSTAALRAELEARPRAAPSVPVIVPVGSSLHKTVSAAGFTVTGLSADAGVTHDKELSDTYQPPPGVHATVFGKVAGPLPPAEPPRPAPVGVRDLAQPTPRMTEKVMPVAASPRGLPIWVLVAIAIGVGVVLGGIGFALLR
jgi:serine/threonine protein kinase